MTDRLRRFCVFVAILPWLVSCNVFAPFDTDSSDQDHLEEALHCLDNRDSQCAVTDYEKLPDGDEKNLGLCEIQLSTAGLTLDTLVNVVLNASTQQNGNYLGAFAGALVPWTADKAAAVASAITSCSALTTGVGQLAPLLQTLSYVTDCTLRIARTDQCRCSSDDSGIPSADPNRPSPTCSASGDNNGLIQKVDIGSGFGGTVDATHPGICATELTSCLYDLANAAQATLLGLDKLQQALNAIPSGLKNTSTGTDVARGLVETEVSQ